jgi:uncharacterized protein (TIGR03118 family)
MRAGINISRSFTVLILVVALLPSSTFAQYVKTDLTSNQSGVAPNTSQHLVNAWGLVQLQLAPNMASPFWISDNGSGFSTLYDGTGALQGLVVTIPPAPGSPQGTLGTPTGIVGNLTPNFEISGNHTSGSSVFIFATMDGTIVGWNPNVDPIDSMGMSTATIAANRSKFGATYTGLAIATNDNGETFLYAADDGPNRRIDMFDGQLNVKSFGDPDIPRNFTPYGIQNINNEIWVTYTALNKAQGGFVDVFNLDGTLKKHFAAHGPLHSPWGLAQAPADFGPMSNAILISNNTSRGRINAFDPSSGAFLGPLRDESNKPIEIDEPWGLQFGLDGGPATAHNQLFFTAGPNNYADGLFGVITVGH